MLDKVKSFLKERTFFYYLQAACGLLAFVGVIIFYMIDVTTIQGNITFTDESWLTLLFISIGFVGTIFTSVTNFKFAIIIPAIFYALGIGQHIYLLVFPFADLMTKVPFFTSNMDVANTVSTIFLVFAIIFIISLVGTIVASFSSLSKKERDI